MTWPDAPTAQLLGEIALWLSIAMALSAVPSVLITRRGNPLGALSWLFTLILFPGVGALLWWFLGRNALRTRRTKRAAKRAEFHQRRGKRNLIQVPERSEQQELLTAAAQREMHHCPQSPVRVLCEGPDTFTRLNAAVAQATQQISVLYYIWANDETGRKLRDALVERAQAGVAVRVLLDSIGSLDLPSDFWTPLTEAKGQVAFFMRPRLWSWRRPSFNFRNHRKVLVVDHCIAFSGGMNVSDHYAKAWKDVHMQSWGEAALALEQIFCDDWYYTTGEYIELSPPKATPDAPDSVESELTVLSSGPDSPQPWIHDHYFRAMASAKQRIWIATPYFIPTESIATALRTAATRGVDVRVLVPGKSDQRLVQWASRAYYPSLLAAGVKIYEYQPEMMHAKVWIIDQTRSAIGSANLDPRSFRLNFEVTNLVEGGEVVETLDGWFRPMLNQSRRVDEKAFAKIPDWKLMRDALAHLWSPLL